MFDDAQAAEDTFDLLFNKVTVADKNAVTLLEFKLALYECFKHRSLVQARVKNYDSLFNVMSSVLSIVFMFLVSIVVLKVFNMSPYGFLTVFSSVVTALSFALRSTIKRVFDSFMFIFVTQPVSFPTQDVHHHTSSVYQN